MRHKFYFGLLLICFSLNANLFAQNFWVPDANAFRNRLKQLYPNCFTAQDSLITNCSANSKCNHTVPVIGIQTLVSLDGIRVF
jgi:hypothetical protein